MNLAFWLRLQAVLDELEADPQVRSSCCSSSAAPSLNLPPAAACPHATPSPPNSPALQVRGAIFCSGLRRDVFTAGNDIGELYAPLTSRERYR